VWQASWPIDCYPLRRDFEALPKWQPGQEEYAFVRVEGDGVHEIPVGPVHAGIIEPGHFRFQVVGEKVLRIEERLGFVHKGSKKRFESMAAATGHRVAKRVPGHSTVAHPWAHSPGLGPHQGRNFLRGGTRGGAGRARGPVPPERPYTGGISGSASPRSGGFHGV